MKTIAELEVLHLPKKISDGDTSMLVIDSHITAWAEKDVIPGAVKIPWDTLDIGISDPGAAQGILKNQLGVRPHNGFLNFDQAASLVLFCNGSWCGESLTTIKGLLKIGYPAHKIRSIAEV